MAFSITGWYPEINEVAVEASELSAVATMPAPSLSAANVAAAPSMSARVTFPNPTLNINQSGFVPVMNAAATMPTPAVSAAVTVTAAEMLASAQMPAPTLSMVYPQAVLPTTLPAILEGPGLLLPPAMQAVASFPAPSLSVTPLTAALIRAIAAFPIPTLSVNSRAALMTGSAQMPVPVIAVPASLTAEQFLATGLMPSPNVAVGGTGQAPLMVAAAAMPAPSVTTATSMTAALMSGAASMPVPTAASVSPVTFDAVGAGFLASSTTGPSPSWSHSIAGNGIIAFLQVFTNNASPTVSASCGGTTMTQLGSPVAYLATSGYYAIVYAFGLLTPPTGSQTVSFTITGPTAHDYIANSMSFNNVTGFGTPVTNSGSTGNPSLTASSVTNQMVANVFSGYTTSFSAYNQTQEYNQGLGAASLSFVMGYAPGASSVSFSATGSQPWGGIAIPVQ